jgi:hypothetical protein
MKRLDKHQWLVTEPTQIKIGRPATRPSPATLQALREIAASSGATAVYWFWMSLAGDEPHLGLAVSPDDDTIVKRLGEGLEPLWRRHSPSSPKFDILRLTGETGLTATIRQQGELLWQQPVVRRPR